MAIRVKIPHCFQCFSKDDLMTRLKLTPSKIFLSFMCSLDRNRDELENPRMQPERYRVSGG
jgi:hypothetical protein